MTASLQDYGLSDTNLPLDREKLSKSLSQALKGNTEQVKEILKVLYSNPDRETDKKDIMKKSELDSSISSTSNQGLGSVIDNLIYYVDSKAWWLKGFNSAKYLSAISRDKTAFRASYIEPNKLNRQGEVITRRRRIARRVK